MKTLNENLDSMREEIQKERQIREELCLQEVTEVLKKYGCTIKCCVTFDEVSNQIIYDKKIVSLNF